MSLSELADGELPLMSSLDCSISPITSTGLLRHPPAAFTTNPSPPSYLSPAAATTTSPVAHHLLPPNAPRFPHTIYHDEEVDPLPEVDPFITTRENPTTNRRPEKGSIHYTGVAADNYAKVALNQPEESIRRPKKEGNQLLQKERLKKDLETFGLFRSRHVKSAKTPSSVNHSTTYPKRLAVHHNSSVDSSASAAAEQALSPLFLNPHDQYDNEYINSFALDDDEEEEEYGDHDSRHNFPPNNHRRGIIRQENHEASATFGCNDDRTDNDNQRRRQDETSTEQFDFGNYFFDYEFHHQHHHQKQEKITTLPPDYITEESLNAYGGAEGGAESITRLLQQQQSSALISCSRQQESASAAADDIYSRRPDLTEPLPLLTELEDYCTGSSRISSITDDCDYCSSSMNKYNDDDRQQRTSTTLFMRNEGAVHNNKEQQQQFRRAIKAPARANVDRVRQLRLGESKDADESSALAAGAAADGYGKEMVVVRGGEIDEYSSHGHAYGEDHHHRNLQEVVAERRELAVAEVTRSLSQKYRPRRFREIVGQCMVTEALANAIATYKIAPAYLFHGPRGTGKTTAARIFAAALRCSNRNTANGSMAAAGEPCGACEECRAVAAGRSNGVKEVDAASYNGVDKVKALLQEISQNKQLQSKQYKVLVIDECHSLSSDTWNALLGFMEEPPHGAVLVFVTSGSDTRHLLPPTASSRCLRFPFLPLTSAQIASRLRFLSHSESLPPAAVDDRTLHLIAAQSDGSLRDAENALEQLCLLLTSRNGAAAHSSSSVRAIFYQMVGRAPEERLVSLLESALAADMVATVKKAREILEWGVEPLALTERLAALIIGILAAASHAPTPLPQRQHTHIHVTEEKLERLRTAMKTLRDAEKQLRDNCNDRATWLTAALLQLGYRGAAPGHHHLRHRNYSQLDTNAAAASPSFCTAAADSRQITQSPVDIHHRGHDELLRQLSTISGRQAWLEHDSRVSHHLNPRFDHNNSMANRSEFNIGGRLDEDRFFHGGRKATSPPPLGFRQQEQEQAPDRCVDAGEHNCRDGAGSELHNVWRAVLEKCRSMAPPWLGQFLAANVKLTSISISEDDAVVHLEVCDGDGGGGSNCNREKKAWEMMKESVAAVFEAVLGFPVRVDSALTSSTEPNSTRPYTAEAAAASEDRQQEQGLAHNRRYPWRSTEQLIHGRPTSEQVRRRPSVDFTRTDATPHYEFRQQRRRRSHEKELRTQVTPMTVRQVILKQEQEAQQPPLPRRFTSSEEGSFLPSPSMQNKGNNKIKGALARLLQLKKNKERNDSSSK